MATTIAVAVSERLAPGQALTAAHFTGQAQQDAAVVEQARLLARAEGADALATEAAQRASGAREMAAILAGQGEPQRAMAYDRDAVAFEQEATARQAEANQLRVKAAKAAVQARTHDEGDLSIVAYLTAGLQRAAGTGKVPDTVGQVADRLLNNWNLLPNEERTGDEAVVRYTVDLTVPLVEGGELIIPLSGRVRNVRKPGTSRARSRRRPPAADMWDGPRMPRAGQMYFKDGMTLDAVAQVVHAEPDRLVLVDLRTWLRDAGMSHKFLISALIDHPLPIVRQVMHQALTHENDGVDLTDLSPAWIAHVSATYQDASMKWNASACPDDLRLVRQITAILGDRGPKPIAELAQTLGVKAKKLEGLATPPKWTNGFHRPRYVNWTDDDHTEIQFIACPYPDCSDQASHAVLLPETGASGCGVICPTCRRMPNTADPKWATIVFPEEYVTRSWNATLEKPRRLVGRTIEVQ